MKLGGVPAVYTLDEHSARIRVQVLTDSTWEKAQLEYFNEEIPLMLGDRFILRESGRNETVGAVGFLTRTYLKASEAQPSDSIERIISEHGDQTGPLRVADWRNKQVENAPVDSSPSTS